MVRGVGLNVYGRSFRTGINIKRLLSVFLDRMVQLLSRTHRTRILLQSERGLVSWYTFTTRLLIATPLTYLSTPILYQALFPARVFSSNMCIGWPWWSLRTILKIALSKRNVISASWVPRKTSKVQLLVILSQHWKGVWILIIDKTWMKLSRLRLLTRSNHMQGENRSDQGKWEKEWDICCFKSSTTWYSTHISHTFISSLLLQYEELGSGWIAAQTDLPPQGRAENGNIQRNKGNVWVQFDHSLFVYLTRNMTVSSQHFTKWIDRWKDDPLVSYFV